VGAKGVERGPQVWFLKPSLKTDKILPASSFVLFACETSSSIPIKFNGEERHAKQAGPDNRG